MKKSFCLLVFLSFYFTNSFSQNHDAEYQPLAPTLQGTTYINPVFLKSKPKGSPYSLLIFTYAKVENVDQKALMRYNIFKDEFEFIDVKKNDTLVLDKIDDFSKITFPATNKKYNLVNYTSTKGIKTRGYLINLYEKAGFALYKKENISFYDEKIAKTSLETNMPARYDKSSDSYFLKNKNNEIFEFPDSKKKLIKLYPDKKEVVENFVKENKISFQKEEDMAKIIDFLVTL